MNIARIGSTICLAIALGALVSCGAGSSDLADNPPKIVIDGRFDDWADVPVLLNTRAEQAPGITAISLSHDDQSVYVRLDLNAKVNMQSLLTGTLTLLFDADGNADTGATNVGLPGADFALELSPMIKRWPGRPRQGARIVVFDDETDLPRVESAYSIGFLSAPTYSASQFEFRFARGKLATGTLPLFAHDHLRGKLIYSLDHDHIIQQTPEFVYQLSATTPTTGLTEQQIEALLGANDPDSIRVLSWNIADHNFQRNFDAFGRILSAIKPDVLLLDEAPQDATLEMIQELLTAMAPAIKVPAWQVQIGQGGGRQRGIVASHLPFNRLPSHDPLHYPENVVDYVRTYGSISMRRDLVNIAREGMPILAVRLDWAGQELLLATMDFQCCGYDGSTEDEFRIHQAKLVRQALSDEIDRSGPPDALILAGDLNLVGSRKPLDILLHGGDLDGNDLISVDPLQLNQATTATYGFHGTFPPGQLDFMWYSNSSLELLRSFVFDSRELSESLASRLGIRPDDSSHSSDHMPIVADFRFRQVSTLASDSTR